MQRAAVATAVCHLLVNLLLYDRMLDTFSITWHHLSYLVASVVLNQPGGILVAEGDELNAPTSQQVLSRLVLHCHTYAWWICTTDGTVYIQSILSTQHCNPCKLKNMLML